MAGGSCGSADDSFVDMELDFKIFEQTYTIEKIGNLRNKISAVDRRAMRFDVGPLAKIRDWDECKTMWFAHRKVANAGSSMISRDARVPKIISTGILLTVTRAVATVNKYSASSNSMSARVSTLRTYKGVELVSCACILALIGCENIWQTN